MTTPVKPARVAVLGQGYVGLPLAMKAVAAGHDVVGIDASTERVKRLEDRGIIVGYSARIDPTALGIGMTAVLRVRTTHEHIKACLKQFAEMPQVMEVLRLTGEDCFPLKVLVPSPGELETIVDTIARFGAVTTSLVLRSENPKPIGRALLQRP